jgi:hypothetical protein
MRRACRWALAEECDSGFPTKYSSEADWPKITRQIYAQPARRLLWRLAIFLHRCGCFFAVLVQHKVEKIGL